MEGGGGLQFPLPKTQLRKTALPLLSGSMGKGMGQRKKQHCNGLMQHSDCEHDH